MYSRHMFRYAGIEYEQLKEGVTGRNVPFASSMLRYAASLNLCNMIISNFSLAFALDLRDTLSQDAWRRGRVFDSAKFLFHPNLI